MRESDVNSTSDLVGVESMSGLAELEHYVIGDVDHIVDRTNAGRFDSCAQPIRTRADLYVFYSARGIERTFAERRNRNARPDLALSRKSFGLRNACCYNSFPG